MSYFGNDDELQFGDPANCEIQDIESNVEVADGVVVERRSVLWLSMAAVGSLFAGALPLRAQDPQPATKKNKQGGLSQEEFLARLYTDARRLIDSKGQDEEAYLMTVAAAMSRLTDPKAPIRDAMRAFSKARREEGKRFPIGVVSMSLEPGKGFSHHDHLNYNGVIMGVEGEVRIRNYDFVGEIPKTDSDKTFEIRETRNDLILPGRFSTLGQNRENIHDLVAGKKGARVLDVFTFFERNATSRYLQVGDKPKDEETRTFEASWRQRRRRNRNRK